MDTTPSVARSSAACDQLVEDCLGALLTYKRGRAQALIHQAREAGISVADLYRFVMEPLLHRVGTLWQTNKISVAQEHYCTAAVQLILAQVSLPLYAVPRNGRRFVGACVAGELYDVGLRMVCDFFDMEGWDSIYLGASVPTTDLIWTLQDQKPQVVGIGATLEARIPTVRQVVEAIRQTPECRGIRILVGGQAFSHAPDLWKQLGADGSAARATDVPELAAQLLTSGS